MKTMAEVIQAHRDIAWNHETSRSICSGCDADLGPMTAYIEKQDAWLIAHQAEVLAAAGYGPVREAGAQALRDAAVIFHGRLPDGTGNGRAYNSYQVADMLNARAAALANP